MGDGPARRDRPRQVDRLAARVVERAQAPEGLGERRDREPQA
jgi:hypothetical protein